MLIIILIFIAAMNIYMMHKKWNIGCIMFINTTWIVFGKNLSIQDITHYLRLSFLGNKTLNLLSLFMIILCLESMMRHQGYIQKMVKGLNILFSGSIVAPCIMPVFIGMLPSPGGARLSCPMVEETTAHTNHQVSKAYTNYWYRHIWMDGFILYPPIIMASKLLNRSVLELFVTLLPIMAVWFFIGLLNGLRHFEKTKVHNLPKHIGLQLFIKGVYPIIILITTYILLLKIGIPHALQLSGSLILLILICVERTNRSQLRTYIKDSLQLKYAIIILGAITFSEFFNGAGLIDDLIVWLNDKQVPTTVLFILLPFATGLLSGISLTFVSVSFPVLIGLGLADDMSLFLLAYTSGVFGVMLTPLHLCSVVSAEYFGVSITKLMKKVAFSCLLIIPALLLFIFL